VAISGHGLAPGNIKESKSRGIQSLHPMRVIDHYSADAVRYWSSSTRLGRDSVISEDKIAVGHKLVTKLWNVGRFALSFLEDYEPPKARPMLNPVDEWLLSRLQGTIKKATQGFEDYDYTTARDETEGFFWNILADNYLEMVKLRLYELYVDDPERVSAQYTLYHALLTVIKLFAPLMPHITEELYQAYYVYLEEDESVHLSPWPTASADLIKASAELLGEGLIALATEVRRFKTANQMKMGAPLRRLLIGTPKQEIVDALHSAWIDIRSVTRAEDIVVGLADLELARAQASIVPFSGNALAIKIIG
jgi:valyl-tRNA synthetase